MIRISKLADYAVVILAALTETPDEVVSTSKLSELTKIPEPTIAKVLKLLVKKDIVASTRGVHGGYKIALKASEVSVLNVIRAIDGPISITSCTNGETPDCSLGQSCSIRGRWDGVNSAIRDALLTVTIADMIKK